MSATTKKNILIFVILVSASCKISSTKITNNLSTSKKTYVVYTQKNCFECFNKLNSYYYNKYRNNNSEFKINYIFYKSNFINTNVVLSKLKKLQNLSIIDFQDTNTLLKVNIFLDENRISPYIIIDSSNIYRIVDYKELFDKDGNVKIGIL